MTPSAGKQDRPLDEHDATPAWQSIVRERFPSTVGRAHPRSTDLLICRYCDTVHRSTIVAKGEAAHCALCDAVLVRQLRLGVDELLALAVAAAILFLIANTTPVVAVEFGGIHIEANILTAVRSMQRGWIGAAGFVLDLTMFLIPLAQIASLLWLLSFACAGRRAPGGTKLLTMLHQLRPWSMTEVFLLGALVVIVKLSDLVHVATGVGIWALGVLTLVLTFLNLVESPYLWSLVESTG